MDKLVGNIPFHNQDLPWEERMAFTLETMREMSRIVDPQELVKAYGARMRQIMPTDGMVSLSRRGLAKPAYRITRSSKWEGENNPWSKDARLAIFDSGLLSELLYGNEPVLIDNLEISPDDPAAEYFEGMKSIMAVPLFEKGEAINMVVVMRKLQSGFSRERLPMYVWMSNLFGRATHTLVLSKQVRTAYDAVEKELKAVADIQHSLLPEQLPEIDGLELAVHYQTSRHAGGDYYDFFKLPEGQWGILIADVSGHGTPAAVLMAITHSIAHVVCDPPVPPGQMLAALNARLTHLYTGGSGNFVTAFYGIYDPRHRVLTWCNAGHPPPRLREGGGAVGSLPLAESLPLGIDQEECYNDRITQLHRGDTLLFFTDGITEARDPDGNLFDVERLDAILCGGAMTADEIVNETMSAIAAFREGQSLTDDQTLLAARLV